MKEPKINKETKKIIKASVKEFFLKFLISIAIRGLLLIIPILWSDVINNISVNNFDASFKMIIWTLILTTIYYLSEIINQYAYYKLYNKLYKSYTSLASVATSKNSIHSLSRFSLSEYTNTLNYDIDIISTFFSNLVLRIVRTFEFIIIFCYFFNVDFYIFLITLGVSIILLSVLILSSRRTEKNNKNRKMDLDKKTSIIHETFNGIKEIKGFNVFKSINNRVEQTCDSYLKSNKIYNVYFKNVKLIVQSILEIVRYGLIFYGTYLITINQIELGTIIIIYTYYGKIIENYDIIAFITAEYKDLKVSLLRFNKLLEFQSNDNNLEYVKEKKYQGHIIFDSVLYGNRQDPILNNVSFEIKPNTLTVITGKAGSGKTGVFDLLLKMNRKHVGKILIDKDNIEQIKDNIYYELISIVRKEPIFFDLSIKENLMLIEPNFDKIIETCKLLQIDEYILSLSNGYDTLINSKEENISTNVKQLIAISRVLLRNSKIMLFDETLSILDKSMEENVLNILTKLKQNHTIIIISRDKEVYKYADLIITLDNNKVLKLTKKNNEKV